MTGRNAGGEAGRITDVAAAVAACALAAGVLAGCTQEVRVFDSPLPRLSSSESSAPEDPAGGRETSDGAPVDAPDDVGDAAALTVPAPLRVDPAGYGFDAAAAIRHAATIASYGPRQGGSTGERKAADYVAGELERLGLEPAYQEFALPGGGTSVNVIDTVSGRDDSRRFLAGGHLDSKPPSPGANDNASGCGVLLEVARVLTVNPPPVTVELVFWGTEEFLPQGVDSHHLGSRHHAEGLTEAERDRLVGALSVDMVGVGTTFHVRTMERGPQSLRRLLLSHANTAGTRMIFLKDRGRTGWSDHEPYELRGIPAAWIEWRDDPHYHTPRDTADRLSRRRMQVTGEFVVSFIHRLDTGRMRALDKGR